MSVRRENGPGPTLGINILTKEPNSSVGSQVRAAHMDAALHSGALPNVHMDMFRYPTELGTVNARQGQVLLVPMETSHGQAP